VGGTIPEEDRAALLAAGVAAVFTPGTPTTDIVAYIQGRVAERAR
jgi:methylmalonyl-CoA mutase C-terminal domain/subunit